jgi:hypothetical protein
MNAGRMRQADIRRQVNSIMTMMMIIVIDNSSQPQQNGPEFFVYCNRFARWQHKLGTR